MSVQDGWTALHIAGQNGHGTVVRMLLNAKADISIKTNVSPIDDVTCTCSALADSIFCAFTLISVNLEWCESHSHTVTV